MTCIPRTDDPDFTVTFDDLAEFASALHRRSYFHFLSPEKLLVSVNFLFIHRLHQPRSVTGALTAERPAPFPEYDTRNVHQPFPENFHFRN